MNRIPALAMPMLGRPAVNALTGGYWAAALEQRLVIQQCNDCGAHRHPPTGVCYRCGSPRWGWGDVSGDGSVFTYVWIDSPMHESLAAIVPYNVCVIELEGTQGDPVRLITNVVGVERETLHIGLPVYVEFVSVDEGALMLPVFRLRSDE